MHLGAYTESSFLGGGEKALATLLRDLDRDIEVTVIGTDPAVVEAVAAERPSARIRMVRGVKDKWDAAGIAAQFRAIREVRPDVLHANGNAWTCQYALSAGVATRGVRTLAVHHAMIPPRNRRQVWLNRLKLKRLDGHVAVSRTGARSVEQMSGLASGSVRVIYNGVPDTPVAPLPRRVDGPVIGSVGRLSREKGHDVMLRALAALPDVTAVLVGDGPDRSSLEALAQELASRRSADHARLAGGSAPVAADLRRLRDAIAAGGARAGHDRGDARIPPGGRLERRRHPRGGARRRDGDPRAPRRPRRARRRAPPDARRPGPPGAHGDAREEGREGDVRRQPDGPSPTSRSTASFSTTRVSRARARADVAEARKALVLAHEPPLPAISGTRVRTLNLMLQLAKRGWNVSLFALAVGEPPDDAERRKLEEICDRVVLEPFASSRASRYRGAAFSRARGRAFQERFFFSRPAARRLVELARGRALRRDPGVAAVHVPVRSRAVSRHHRPRLPQRRAPPGGDHGVKPVAPAPGGGGTPPARRGDPVGA